MSTQLKSAIKFVGLDPLLFKGHSFRIGAATYAAFLGYSEQLIKKLGRWNSDVFHRYIQDLNHIIMPLSKIPPKKFSDVYS